MTTILKKPIISSLTLVSNNTNGATNTIYYINYVNKSITVYGVTADNIREHSTYSSVSAIGDLLSTLGDTLIILEVNDIYWYMYSDVPICIDDITTQNASLVVNGALFIS